MEPFSLQKVALAVASGLSHSVGDVRRITLCAVWITTSNEEVRLEAII